MTGRRSTILLQRGGGPVQLACIPRALALSRRHQTGVFAIMFVPLLVVIIGFYGLAIDIGQLYNRKVDMQGIARAAALAAARELNGTPEGITAAKAAARAAAERLYYRNLPDGVPVSWADEALSFGPRLLAPALGFHRSQQQEIRLTSQTCSLRASTLPAFGRRLDG